MSRLPITSDAVRAAIKAGEADDGEGVRKALGAGWRERAPSYVFDAWENATGWPAILTAFRRWLLELIAAEYRYNFDELRAAQSAINFDDLSFTLGRAMAEWADDMVHAAFLRGLCPAYVGIPDSFSRVVILVGGHVWAYRRWRLIGGVEVPS